MTIRDVKELIKHLKETLNPHTCRGFVDCFLIRKQKEEVKRLILSVFHLTKITAMLHMSIFQ